MGKMTKLRGMTGDQLLVLVMVGLTCSVGAVPTVYYSAPAPAPAPASAPAPAPMPAPAPAPAQTVRAQSASSYYTAPRAEQASAPVATNHHQTASSFRSAPQSAPLPANMSSYSSYSSYSSLPTQTIASDPLVTVSIMTPTTFKCGCVSRTRGCSVPQEYTRSVSETYHLQCTYDYMLCCYRDTWPGGETASESLPCVSISYCSRYYGQDAADVAKFGNQAPCGTVGHVRCIQQNGQTRASVNQPAPTSSEMPRPSYATAQAVANAAANARVTLKSATTNPEFLSYASIVDEFVLPADSDSMDSYGDDLSLARESEQAQAKEASIKDNFPAKESAKKDKYSAKDNSYKDAYDAKEQSDDSYESEEPYRQGPSRYGNPRPFGYRPPPMMMGYGMRPPPPPVFMPYPPMMWL